MSHTRVSPCFLGGGGGECGYYSGECGGDGGSGGGDCRGTVCGGIKDGRQFT